MIAIAQTNKLLFKLLTIPILMLFPLLLFIPVPYILYLVGVLYTGVLYTFLRLGSIDVPPFYSLHLPPLSI